MINVIVAEPNVVLRTGIRAVLERHEEIAIASEALTAKELCCAILDLPHEVVFAEMGLLTSIGSRALRELRRVRPASRFLVHSYEKDTDFGAQAFRFGATGYVANDCSASDLCAAILNVAAGAPYISASLGDDLAAAVCFRAANMACAPLSARERRVFKMLAIGLTDVDVARQLRAPLPAVDACKMRIMAKLEMTDCSELVRHAISQSLSRKDQRSPWTSPSAG